ncbi:MAG: ABC transporter permease subunit [Burkholderiaceae bacterium]|jgi:NitT/TauT family transport system permease protein
MTSSPSALLASRPYPAEALPVLSDGASPAPVADSLEPALSAVPTVPHGVGSFWSLGLGLKVVLAALSWIGLGLLTGLWPNKLVGFSDWAYTPEFGITAGAFGALLLVAALLGRDRSVIGRWLCAVAPWLIALALVLGLWEVATAKRGWLVPPFFAPPQNLVEVYLEDWRRLGDSAWQSIRLLLQGLGFGIAAGFLTGVSIGWSRQVGYWVHPLLRLLGPVPASALLPLAFFAFPSSHAAAVFLIALAAFFPVAILTWSGVAGVNRQYYDVARTLGASETFLILRVAIPAALPQVFVGLFMGLGAAFSVLVTAEMMGVKAGLGWYLTWAQGWASYSNMYAALIVMALVCSGTVTLLFVLRDHVLSWQKGTLKW